MRVRNRYEKLNYMLIVTDFIHADVKNNMQNSFACAGFEKNNRGFLGFFFTSVKTHATLKNMNLFEMD